MESHVHLPTPTPSATTETTDLAKTAAAFWPISAHPFRKVGTVDDLIEKGLPPAPWLDAPGVYAIVAPVGYEFEVLDDETVEDAYDVPVDVPRSRWVPAARVLYIGVATTTLRERIDALIDHAVGDTTEDGPHRDGETVWQLAGYESFMVMAMATTDPAALEATLLAQFVKRFGGLPFGNWTASDDPAAPNAVQRVLADARKAIVLETIRTAPQDATIGELRQALTKRGLDDAFLVVTFGEMRCRGDNP